jgi:branched-chain amino acid transport system substrate-binding protein
MRIARTLIAISGTLALGAGVAACGGQSSGQSSGGASSASGGSGGAKSGPLTIGATYEKTGPVPTLGAEAAGVQAAVAYLNAHGGVMGRQIKIQLEDNAGNPSQAVSNLRQFSQQGINLVLGGAFGIDCDAEAPVAAKLNQIAVCGSTDDLPSGDSHMFGIGPGYSPTLKVIAQLLRRYGTKTVVFSDNSSDGGAEAKELATDFKAVGGTASLEQYPVTATTFTSEMQKAVSQHPDTIQVTSCGPGAVTQVQEAESLGFKGKISLDNCQASTESAQALKGLAGDKQVIVLSPYSLLSTPAPDPAERKAIALYKSQVPGPVNTVETAGWDSMMVLAKAITAAHSTSTPALLKTLTDGFSYTGVWHAGTFTSADHRAARTAGYTVPTFFTSKGTIEPLPAK